MLEKKIIKIIFVLIFIAGSFLRLHLAFVNRDANDNHQKVIRIISTENRIPGKEEFECLQCYHPKLYHYTAAKIINFFSASSTDMTDEQKIISQMLNALAGIATIFTIYFFLKKFNLDAKTRLITFSLFAMNPALIGINGQATNDSFVILFSTLSIFYLYSFLKENHWTDLAYLSISVILASLSKGSGLIIFFGILIIFSLKILANIRNLDNLKKLAFSASIFFAICFSFIIAVGPYAEYYFTYGTPFVLNKPKSAMPNFLERTYEGDKTGVTSIFDSYLTFRFFDLIKNPYLNRETEPEKYSLNRMSLWTQLYARNNFIQFEGHPKKWFIKLTNPIYNLGKVIFIFALIPLAIFICGIFVVTKKSIVGFWRDKFSYLKNEDEWIFVFFFWVFILFIIKFTLDYRDFTTMKPIYLFPGLLAFAYIFAMGLENILKKIKKSTPLAYGLQSIIIMLIFLYIFDITHLINRIS